MSRLVTVAHGTRVAAGNLVAAELTRQASALLGASATTSYVELCTPLVGDVLGASSVPTVVVPLLLSTGYHVKVDIPAALRGGAGPAALTRPLGPDPVLAGVQRKRLLEAGATPGNPVVLVAAGSNDPDAVPDLERAACLLAGVWGGPVLTATVSGAGRSIESAVAEASLYGEVAVSTYLLSPGFFARKVAAAATEAGATVVSDVLGADEAIAGLIADRYREARSALRIAA
ncbi:sirohydrochlorin chelatase [Nocardioides jiangxiensis]|uniref:CbiX/SirB N-terminal domain-containing protein n=1 Tax=Nocardioides jiangxiensis TaxID=3064524 RepID=A0ABT9B3B2_9ACTN|nr:CbiX/SirB N-terminal domain-containing protein [Nocardioides sp. WY-20]MDO7867781.1 CbiX/SirB N-terminal domain-containing protein [Nocardioides sp. WY-20]